MFTWVLSFPGLHAPQSWLKSPPSLKCLIALELTLTVHYSSHLEATVFCLFVFLVPCPLSYSYSSSIPPINKGPTWLGESLSVPRMSPATAWQAWHGPWQAAAGQLPAPIATWYSRSVAMVTRIIAEMVAEKAGKMEREPTVHAQRPCPRAHQHRGAWWGGRQGQTPDNCHR